MKGDLIDLGRYVALLGLVLGGMAAGAHQLLPLYAEALHAKTAPFPAQEAEPPLAPRIAAWHEREAESARFDNMRRAEAARERAERDRRRHAVAAAMVMASSRDEQEQSRPARIVVPQQAPARRPNDVSASRRQAPANSSADNDARPSQRRNYGSGLNPGHAAMRERGD